MNIRAHYEAFLIWAVDRKWHFSCFLFILYYHHLSLVLIEIVEINFFNLECI
jgi:hypothetical protein